MKKAKKRKIVKKDLYQEVTNKIITMLENGVTPWRCTWNKYGLARNYANGNAYSGINMLLMNCTEYPIPYFMSFKQAQEKGGRICKGAKAETVYYYSVFYKDGENNTVKKEDALAMQEAGKDVDVLSFLKYYNVFNIQDVEGIEFEIPEVELRENERITKCERIVAKMPDKPELKFIDADRPFYYPTRDILNMPDICQFESSEVYYAIYFHELIHSTGHESRLARKGIIEDVEFGSKTYSEEELIAEMGASFLCAHVGIDYDAIMENSVAYIQGWLKVLKEDKKFVFKVAAEAGKGVDFVLGR